MLSRELSKERQKCVSIAKMYDDCMLELNEHMTKIKKLESMHSQANVQFSGGGDSKQSY